MGEVIAENGLTPHIRYGHKILTAAWSSAEKRWTVETTQVETGAAKRFTGCEPKLCPLINQSARILRRIPFAA